MNKFMYFKNETMYCVPKRGYLTSNIIIQTIKRLVLSLKITQKKVRGFIFANYEKSRLIDAKLSLCQVQFTAETNSPILPEAPSATENGGTQAPYDISQNKTSAEEMRSMGVWGLAPRKCYRATPSRTSENAMG